MKPVVIVPFYKNVEQLAKCEASAESQAYNFQVVDDSLTGHGFTKTVNKGLKSWLVEGLGREKR